MSLLCRIGFHSWVSEHPQNVVSHGAYTSDHWDNANRSCLRCGATQLRLRKYLAKERERKARVEAALQRINRARESGSPASQSVELSECSEGSGQVSMVHPEGPEWWLGERVLVLGDPSTEVSMVDPEKHEPEEDEAKEALK